MPKKFFCKNPKPGLKQNLIGKKTGKLLILKEIGRNKRQEVIWECICNCGNITQITTAYFNSGKKTSCGCSLKEKGEKSKTWTGYKEISGTLIAIAKSGAVKRNLEFNVTNEDLWEQFLKQERKCALTGIILTFSPGQSKTNKERTLGTASLDRIDSNKGYIKDNIQWVHKDINLMKNKFNQDYFISMCKLITENKC